MEQLLIFAMLVALGYFAGHAAEKRHYRSIENRERSSVDLPVVTFGKHFVPERPVESARMVTGSVVISIDYFKRIMAALRGIFGGEVSAYETLVDRARREAVLRMREAAPGADIILNCRIETVAIGQSANQRNSIGSVEAIAYGTAIWYRIQ